MLGAIAAVALVVGSLFATASVTGSDTRIVERSGEPVVEAQIVESSDSAFD